jgi:hypothetical protein
MTRRPPKSTAARRTYTRREAAAAASAFERYAAAEVAVHATEASMLAYNALYRSARARAGETDILHTARKAFGRFLEKKVRDATRRRNAAALFAVFTSQWSPLPPTREGAERFAMISLPEAEAEEFGLLQLMGVRFREFCDTLVGEHAGDIRAYDTAHAR